MKLVIDSNRVISSLIKDGATRKIIFNPEHEFIAPEHLSEEIEKHKKLIQKKSGVDPLLIDVLLSMILQNITITPKEEYIKNISSVKDLIDDKDDLPFLALAIAKKADGIWTEDKHFLKQKIIKIYTTKELI